MLRHQGQRGARRQRARRVRPRTVLAGVLPRARHWRPAAALGSTAAAPEQLSARARVLGPLEAGDAADVDHLLHLAERAPPRALGRAPRQVRARDGRLPLGEGARPAEDGAAAAPRLRVVEVGSPDRGHEVRRVVVRGGAAQHALGNQLLGHGDGITVLGKFVGRQDVLEDVVPEVEAGTRLPLCGVLEKLV